MVEAIARRIILADETVASTAHLVQMDATKITAEADRLSWPDTGSEVVKVTVEINDAHTWREVGSFAAAGGEHITRAGVPAPVSAATFQGRIPAGSLLRVSVHARADIETAVRLSWS